jgi:hypothetical protein
MRLTQPNKTTKGLRCYVLLPGEETRWILEYAIVAEADTNWIVSTQFGDGNNFALNAISGVLTNSPIGSRRLSL